MATVPRRALAHGERRVEVEAALLDAAAALLSEGRAFPALSVGEIARRADIGRTAFYFYFPAKRDLLRRLAEDLAGELSRRGEAWWQGDGDGAEQLREVLPPLVGFALDRGPIVRAVIETAPLDPVVAGFWQDAVDRFVATTVARVEREQAAGRISTWSGIELVRGLVWMTERSCYRFAVEGDRDREAFVRALTEIWIRALYCSSS